MVILRQVFDLDFQMSVTQIDFFSRLKLAIEDYSHCFLILRQQATQPAKNVHLTLFLTPEVRIPNFPLGIAIH